MQLLSAIFVAIAAQGAVVSAAPSLPGGLWCNDGTAGNGGCEANNLHTYCCNYQPTDFFHVFRAVTVPSKNPQGTEGCDYDGMVYCA
ncbi:hypothetical protein E4U58_000763 [Claviceps cyperi]|nr:hypothetical protein E4U58_000763 [Claviceps cyperi]